MARSHSAPFNPEGKLFARRVFYAGGVRYKPGDEFDENSVSQRSLRNLYNQKLIVHVEDENFIQYEAEPDYGNMSAKEAKLLAHDVVGGDYKTKLEAIEALKQFYAE